LAFSQTKGVFDAAVDVFVEEQPAKSNERNAIENKMFFFIFVLFQTSKFLKTFEV
jgi:hypothetical protein